MATILSTGLRKPANPDTGDTFYQDMADAIQRLNDHTHNGADGQLLAITSQNILAAAWVATSGGTYRQLVTLPGTLTYDTITIEWRLSTGERVHPTVERVSATTFYVYTNDNTLQYKALYR
jgi:hypothetical protein